MENLKKNLFKVVIAFIVFIAGLVILPCYSKADEINSTGDLDLVLTIEGAYPEVTDGHKYGMNRVSEVYYYIKNQSGEYLCFDSSLKYTGKQVEPNIIVVQREQFQECNEGCSSVVTLKGIPDGDYTIEFAQKNGDCIEREDEYYDFETIPNIENGTISINGSVTTVNTSIFFKGVHGFILYYIDETGTNPEIYWRLGKNVLFKFNYRKDSEGNNVYEWAKDGTIEDIKIVSGERTIVVPPVGDSGIYNVSSKIYPNCVLLNTNGGVHATGSWNFAREDDYTGSDSIYLPRKDDLGFAYVYTNAQKAFTINKIGSDGATINSEFILSDAINWNNIQNKVIFDHYDTYELNGNEYTNVYVVKEMVEANDANINSGIIETINGCATIIYPLIKYDGGHNWSETHYYLYEVGTDNEYMYNNAYYCGEIIGDEYGLNVTLNDEAFPSEYGRIFENARQISYDDIEVAIDTEIEDEIVTKIINEKKPSVTKIVLDEDGNVDTDCEDTFVFGLYKMSNTNGEQPKLIATVNVKANETKYFDVQINDFYADNYYGSGSFFIAEFKNDKYYVSDAELTGVATSKYILTDEQYNEIDKTVVICGRSLDMAINAVFTNAKKKMPSVTKHVVDYNKNEIEDADGTYEFILFNEDLEIISTVKAKANEQKYFEVQSNLYNEGERYYIAEVKNNNGHLVMTSQSSMISDEKKSQIEQKIGKSIEAICATFVCNFDEPLNIDFYNLENAKISITKKVENDEECADEFTFNIYNQATSELITKINVKAGETAVLNCNELGIVNGMGLIIAEEGKKGFELTNLSDISENVGQKQFIEGENDLNLNGWIYTIRYFEMAPSNLYNLIFTNKAETISIDGKKIWNDDDNKYGKRPKNIIVNLLADGEIIKSVDVSENENGEWIFNFSDLIKYKNGTEVEYSISENPIDEYKTEINGYNITNTLLYTEDEETQETKIENEENKSDNENNIPIPAEETTENENNEEQKNVYSQSLKTGDKIVIYAFLCAISFAGMIIVVRNKRK